MDQFENDFAKAEDLGVCFLYEQQIDQFFMYLRIPYDGTNTLVSHSQVTSKERDKSFPTACNYVRSQATRDAAFEEVPSRTKARRVQIDNKTTETETGHALIEQQVLQNVLMAAKMKVPTPKFQPNEDFIREEKYIIHRPNCSVGFSKGSPWRRIP